MNDETKRDRWQACLAFLEDCTRGVLAKCRVESEFATHGETRRYVLYVPSGDMKYGAFWVRDSAMMAQSGLIPAGDIAGWIKLIAVLGQNGPETVPLENGLSIPPWAVADHVNLDGGAVYYPGTYSAGRDQGDGTFGVFPPHDDQYYFIEMGAAYLAAGGDADFFRETAGGVPLWERFESAFRSYNIDATTGLCVSELPGHTVDWGFCDSIVKSGLLLFPSLLRFRAALRLAALFDALGDGQKARHYEELGAVLRENIQKTFWDGSGWLLSATGMSRQKDVWGTAFALWLGVLPEPEAQRAAGALREAYRNGTATDHGYIRHILVGEDASTASAWEKACVPVNEYQNGGYWSTPTGWYIYGLSLADPNAALELTEELIKHTEAWQDKGAPFEWRSPDDKSYSGLYYGASAALPYAAVRRVAGELG